MAWKYAGNDGWKVVDSNTDDTLFLVGGSKAGYWELWFSDNLGGSSRIDAPTFKTKKSAIAYAKKWMRKNPRG